MINIGDTVAVKPGIQDVDFDIDIGGWQGRVVEVKPQEDVLVIHWDSVTLRQMPDEMIETCIERGLSWTLYHIGEDEVAPASPRDTQADVDRAVEELEKKHAWAWIGPEGENIRRVLADVDPDDTVAAFKAWRSHIEEHLSFPFEARVDEYQDRGPLQVGDRVTVTGITSLDYSYGVIVSLRQGRQRYDFPLCDLEALNEDSDNYQMIRDYRVWFANR